MEVFIQVPQPVENHPSWKPHPPTQHQTARTPSKSNHLRQFRKPEQDKMSRRYPFTRRHANPPTPTTSNTPPDFGNLASSATGILSEGPAQEPTPTTITTITSLTAQESVQPALASQPQTDAQKALIAEINAAAKAAVEPYWTAQWEKIKTRYNTIVAVAPTSREERLKQKWVLAKISMRANDIRRREEGHRRRVERWRVGNLERVEGEAERSQQEQGNGL